MVIKHVQDLITSAKEVMSPMCPIVGWSFGCLNGLLVGLLGSCLVGYMVGWLFGWLVSWLVGRLISWLVGWLVGWKTWMEDGSRPLQRSRQI